MKLQTRGIMPATPPKLDITDRRLINVPRACAPIAAIVPAVIISERRLPQVQAVVLESAWFEWLIGERRVSERFSPKMPGRKCPI